MFLCSTLLPLSFKLVCSTASTLRQGSTLTDKRHVPNEEMVKIYISFALEVFFVCLFGFFFDKTTYSERYFCHCDFPTLWSPAEDFSSWCITWNGVLKPSWCWVEACMIFYSISKHSGCIIVWSVSHARNFDGAQLRLMMT